jgi:AbrB family looped-hinge helix DNA binding protein
MTVVLKPKAEITIPKSVRQKAGFRAGDELEFRVSGRSITICPRLDPDEVQDQHEVRNPRIRAAIRQGYQDFVAGKSRPIEELFAKRGVAARRPMRRNA